MLSANCPAARRIRTFHFGLKLHFGNSDVDLDSPQHVTRLREVFHAANAYHMAIVVHMRPSVTRRQTVYAIMWPRRAAHLEC